MPSSELLVRQNEGFSECTLTRVLIVANMRCKAGRRADTEHEEHERLHDDIRYHCARPHQRLCLGRR